MGARTPTAALLAPRPPVAQRGPGAPSRPPCRDAYSEQSIRRRQEPIVGESSAKPRIPAQRAAHNPRADPLEALDRARRTRFPCPCQTPASSRARRRASSKPCSRRRRLTAATGLRQRHGLRCKGGRCSCPWEASMPLHARSRGQPACWRRSSTDTRPAGRCRLRIKPGLAWRGAGNSLGRMSQ